MFEQTGGFMGRRIDVTVNLEELPPDQASALHNMVEQANFRELGEDLAPRPARDDFHYRVTVETETWQHTVRVTDTNAPQELRPLLQELSKLARLRKR
jgi:hypothetical protein